MTLSANQLCFGAPRQVFGVFSGAPDVLVVLFVPTQQMFSGSVVRAVFCEERGPLELVSFLFSGLW